MRHRPFLTHGFKPLDAFLDKELEEEQIDPYETTMSRLEALQDGQFSRKLEKTVQGKE